MSYPRANRIGKKRHSRKMALRVVGAVVLLVLVGVGTYLFVERREEIAATQASFRDATPAASAGTSIRPTTARPVEASVAPPAPAVTTTTEVPAPEPTPAPAAPEQSAEPAAPSGTDQTYLDLLSASGYPVDTDNSRVFIDQGIAACQALRGGQDGQEVVNTISTAAQGAGLTADQGEGVVYIGVASYCDEVSDQLP